LARLVEKQMRNWELARSQKPASPEERAAPVRDFLSISYGIGSGGDCIAARLADALRWPLFDKAILQEMAGNDDVRRRLYESIDQRDLSWFEEIGRSLGQEEFHRNDYFHRLVTTVLAIARRGPAVFLGRATDLILPRRHGFRVRFMRSRNECIAAHARRQRLDRDTAREEIEEIERDREKFVTNHFHVDARDPARFDLIVNLDAFSDDQALALVLGARLTHLADRASDR